MDLASTGLLKSYGRFEGMSCDYLGILPEKSQKR